MKINCIFLIKISKNKKNIDYHNQCEFGSQQKTCIDCHHFDKSDSHQNSNFCDVHGSRRSFHGQYYRVVSICFSGRVTIMLSKKFGSCNDRAIVTTSSRRYGNHAQRSVVSLHGPFLVGTEDCILQFHA